MPESGDESESTTGRTFAPRGTSRWSGPSARSRDERSSPRGSVGFPVLKSSNVPCTESGAERCFDGNAGCPETVPPWDSLLSVVPRADPGMGLRRGVVSRLRFLGRFRHRDRAPRGPPRLRKRRCVSASPVPGQGGYLGVLLGGHHHGHSYPDRRDIVRGHLYLYLSYRVSCDD